MKLNQWLTQEFINSISFLNENENSNLTTIYYLLYGLYGNRETSSIVDSVNDKTIIADIVNTTYLKKWNMLKNIYSMDIEIKNKENGTTVTETNDIYGYNGEYARDYTKVIETLKNNNYNDLFTLIKNDLDTFQNLNYYKIIVKDIADIVTTVVYYTH